MYTITSIKKFFFILNKVWRGGGREGSCLEGKRIWKRLTWQNMKDDHELDEVDVTVLVGVVDPKNVLLHLKEREHFCIFFHGDSNLGT